MRKSLFIVCVWLLGCGDSGAGQCGAFTPCGGAIVGNWRITGYCSNITGSSSSSCTGMTANAQVQVNGTLSFTSTGTYSIAGTESGTDNVTYPQACLTSMNMTCARLGTALNAGITGISGSCQSNANGDCACAETVANRPISEQGTYSTSGSSLAMIKTGGTTSEGSTEYCVQGDTLMMQATSPTMSGSSTLTATKE